MEPGEFLRRVENTAISITGLGYVGLPIAIEFSKHFRVIAYDKSEWVIENYKNGRDITGTVGSQLTEARNIEFTNDPSSLREAVIHIISVPTPITPAKEPDLSFIEDATNTIAKYIKGGDIVIYESTVYPGLTEEVLIKLLEAVSGMKCGVDFYVGYSPERINPGDSMHSFTNVVKVISAMDEKVLDIMELLYSRVVKAGIFRASSIRVAEAAKVIENIQRDINIALVNELSMIFAKMGITTADVLDAASTKWNFVRFYPGLVGGHCIGVDPYYLTYKAQELGIHPEVILAGRKINDSMPHYIVNMTIRLLAGKETSINKSNVLVMGITYKADIGDIRNSKSIEIVNILTEYRANVIISDPCVEEDILYRKYKLDLIALKDVKDIDCMIVSVAHTYYKDISKDRLISMFRAGAKPLVIDIYGIYRNYFKNDKDVIYWTL